MKDEKEENILSHSFFRFYTYIRHGIKELLLELLEFKYLVLYSFDVYFYFHFKNSF